MSSLQGDLNRNAAGSSSLLNDVNQVTPYGTVNYTAGGLIGGYPGSGPFGLNGSPGVPQMTATTTLSPGMQKLFNTSLRNSQTSANTQAALGKNVQSMLSKNVDLGPSATSAYLDKLNAQTMDPQWAQAQTALNQQLTNQGLTPGSEGWNAQQTQFGLNKANAYNNMYLQGQNTAVQDILAQYNTPLNTLNALKTGSQVQQPSIGQLAPTANNPIQPANYEQAALGSAQIAAQNYAQQQASSNSMMNGLFGLGGQLLGAAPGLISSDERMKTDITPLGKDPETGLPMSAYRYKDDPKTYPKVVGPMAADVEQAEPGSTRSIGGRLVVKPDAAAKFGLGGPMRKAA